LEILTTIAILVEFKESVGQRSADDQFSGEIVKINVKLQVDSL
jgi:hypothetical protein